MTQMDYEPFAGIIQRALQARGTAEGDLPRDPRHLAPQYVVRMCAALPGPPPSAAGVMCRWTTSSAWSAPAPVPTTTTSWHCAARSSPVERRLPYMMPA